MLRFFFKFGNSSVSVCDHDTKTACFFDRYRHTCDGHICMVCFVIVKHHLVIHFVNVVAGKNQNIFRIVCFHISHVLVNCICSSCIPFAVCTFFVWRQNGYAAFVFIEIPRNTDSDMGIQPQRLILGQYAYRINS